MSSDLESTLAQIRELKLQLSGGTPSDPKNAQTNLDPKHKNESTSGQATAADNKPAISKDAASMSTVKQGDDTGSTSRAAGAMGMAGGTGDNARPTSNLIHTDSRDNTHDGFGGCSSPCNRYGEQTDQDSQQPGSLSPSTSHTATIPESKSVVHSENMNRPHGQDVENTSPFVSTPEKEVKDKKDEAVEARADEPESSPPKESHVPPELHAAVASTSKPSPYPIGPGDQVIEHVKRIHQGGMAPGPDGKPTPTPGKTLLTTISSQGTTYALSDKDLPPGQQVVETLETIYEGFELPGTEGSATLTPATPNKRRWSWFAPMSSPGSAKASPAKGANVLAAAPPSGPSDAQTPAGPTEGAPATPERPGQQKVKSGFLDTLIGRTPSKRSEEKARSQEPVVAESVSAPSAAAPEAQNQETTTASATSPAVGSSDVEQPPSSRGAEAAPSPNVGVNDRPAQQRGWSGFLETLKAKSPSKHAKAEQGNVQQFENVAEAPETASAPPSNVQSQEVSKPAVINLNEEPPTNPQQPVQDTISPNVDASQRPAQSRGRSGLFGTLVGRSKEKGKGREPESAAEGAPESSPAPAAPEGQSQDVKGAAAVNPAEVALPASPKEEEPPRIPAADVSERPAQQRGRPSFFETLIGRSPGRHGAREEKGKVGEAKDVEGAQATAPSAPNVETQERPNAVTAEVSDALKTGEVEDQDRQVASAPEPSTSQSAEVAQAPGADQANVESTAKPQVTEGTLSPNVVADERPPQTKKRSSFFGGLIKSPSKHVYEEKGKAEKPDSGQQEPAAAPLPPGPKEEGQDASTASAANPPTQSATAETPAAPQTAEDAPSPSPNVKSGFLDTLMGRSPSKHVDKGKLKEQEQPQPQDTPTSEGQGATSQAEAPSVPRTSAQDQGTAGAPSPEHHWFDRFLDGLGGRKEKVVPPVQN